MYSAKSLKLYSIIILIFTFSILFFNGCTTASNIKPVSKTGFAFDTVISITIYDNKKSDVLSKCFSICEKYEALFSATRDDSEIWKINHSNGMPVNVSFDTACLVQAALSWCEMSNGTLDLTMLPISDEWNISGQMSNASADDNYEYYIPDSDTLNNLLKNVDYKNVIIYDENKIPVGYNEKLSNTVQYQIQLTNSNSAIDLGFIAKGYIADRLKEFLLSEGIENGVISLGGNILLIGEKSDGSPFQVGIQKPFGNAGEVITTIKEANKSIVSSGCYERYFIKDKNEKDENIYHHIFDTTTGTPIQNNLLGVTIISDSSLQGDALSTYCYILGLEDGMKFIKSLENVKAIFITKEYEIIKSW